MKSRPICDSSNLNHASMLTESFSLDIPVNRLLSRCKPLPHLAFIVHFFIKETAGITCLKEV